MKSDETLHQLTKKLSVRTLKNHPQKQLFLILMFPAQNKSLYRLVTPWGYKMLTWVSDINLRTKKRLHYAPFQTTAQQRLWEHHPLLELTKRSGPHNGDLAFKETAVMKQVWRFQARESASSSFWNAFHYEGSGGLTLGPPPCIFRARTVATNTTTLGTKPDARHLMLKNFSIPISAPKPASVTVENQGGDL